MLNAGIDWTKTWPKVPPNDKAVLYQMVCNMSALDDEHFIVSIAGPPSGPLYGTI